MKGVKQQKVSEMLEKETKKMEEKLELVKKMMELEKDKRSQVSSASSGGSMWRGATTKKNTKGYAEAIISNHKKAQPVLPPTTKITETRQSRDFMPPTLLKPNQNVGNKYQINNNIENNLKGAINQQNNEDSEVFSFLAPMKLEKYADKFIENGVEDIETILELEDQHVEQMGIPLGHKLKIVKKIKDMRAERGMSKA